MISQHYKIRSVKAWSQEPPLIVCMTVMVVEAYITLLHLRSLLQRKDAIHAFVVIPWSIERE